MLFPHLNQCTFDDDNDKAQTKLRSLSREADKISADFGGWLSVPRKRRSKPRSETDSDKAEKKPMTSGDKLKCVIAKNDQYYKRYRTDPLEGTFKHFMNYGQYIKVYRETTTLCYKQKTLHELTSLYSATLDIGSNWQSYAMEELVQERNRANRGLSWQEQIPEHRKNNMVMSQSVGIAPLMLLPTAPSIPNTRIAMDEKPLGIGQPAFMCNAYLNRNTVCPVHRLIHRRNVVISDRNMRCPPITPGMRLDHIKVELPGIPKRRYNVQIKRLRNNMKDSPHSPSDEIHPEKSCHSHAPPNSKGTTPSATPRPMDEDEDSVASERINSLLSNTPISPSEKISSALSRNKKSLEQGENLSYQGSMCLPITAILQYLPTHNISEVPSKIVRSKKAPPKTNAKFKNLAARQVPPRKELKQMDKVNYEKQYERYLAAVLESKGRAVQKRHYQNLSK